MRIPTAIGWIVATTLAFALGATLSGALVGAIARPLSPVFGGMVYVLVYGAAIGIVVGLAQWFALERGVVSMRRWILTASLGAGVGYAAAAVVGEALGNAIDPAVSSTIAEAIIEIASGAILGLSIGFAQRLALGRALARSRWWVVASVVGGGLGYGAATAALELFEIPVLKTNLVPAFGAILGLFVGVSQGLVGPRRSRTGRAGAAS